MSENNAVEQLLYRVHLFITEGQLEEALTTLTQIQTEEPQQLLEIAYLRAWCSTLHERWDEAAQILLTAGVAHFHLQDLGQTERRRRAHYLLLLGDIAMNLKQFEEATGHYTLCIKLLDERRMNIPSVRVKARKGLGAAYTLTGFYTVALTHYTEALRLCGDEATHPDLSDIYYGLCETHRHLGNFAQAMEFGKQALQLYIGRSDKATESQVRNLLGQVCYQMHNLQHATSYYTESLSLAMSVNNPRLIMANYIGLADVHLEERTLDDAQRFCEQAREYLGRVHDNHLLGMVYIVCGKVAEAEAKADEKTLSELYLQKSHEAQSWYQQAIDALKATQAKMELSEAYGRLAQWLEATGQQDRAITYWKSAYSVYSQTEGSRS